MAQVDVAQLWQLGQTLFVNLSDLVASQVELLQDWQTLPAAEGGDLVGAHVELFKLWHGLEWGKVLELVVNC